MSNASHWSVPPHETATTQAFLKEHAAMQGAVAVEGEAVLWKSAASSSRQGEGSTQQLGLQATFPTAKPKARGESLRCALGRLGLSPA